MVVVTSLLNLVILPCMNNAVDLSLSTLISRSREIETHDSIIILLLPSVMTISNQSWKRGFGKHSLFFTAYLGTGLLTEFSLPQGDPQSILVILLTYMSLWKRLILIAVKASIWCEFDDGALESACNRLRSSQWTLSLSLSIYIYGTLTPSHKSGKKWGKVSGPYAVCRSACIMYTYVTCNIIL